MYIVFYLLLNIVHFLNDLCYYVYQQYEWLRYVVKNYRFHEKNNARLMNNSNIVGKNPKHIALLLGHEEASVVDLLKLISWSILAGIPHITLYDHKGDLKKIPVIANLSTDSSSNGKKNGSHSRIARILENFLPEANLIDERNVKIQILSYTDGKDRIASLTTDLGKSITQNSLQLKDITCELLNEKLSFNVPDPDLAIIFGKAMCSYGFLPWQARITEFFLIQSHHGISHNEFKETLIKFSKCEQHFGK